MYEHEKKQLLCVVYDGIENSVFMSQVLAPLLTLLDADEALEITLVSFERSYPSSTLLCQKIPAHDRLHLVICRKMPFWGVSSLWIAIYQLFKLLETIPCHEIRARGPLAGFIVRKALDRFNQRYADKVMLDPEVIAEMLVHLVIE